MHEHNGFAAIKLLEDRFISRVAQPLIVVTAHKRPQGSALRRRESLIMKEMAKVTPDTATTKALSASDTRFTAAIVFRQTFLYELFIRNSRHIHFCLCMRSISFFHLLCGG